MFSSTDSRYDVKIEIKKNNNKLKLKKNVNKYHFHGKQFNNNK